MIKNITYGIISLLLIIYHGFVRAEDFLTMDVEALMDLEIVSTHKSKEKFFTTPAAMYVITRQDIEQSSAETITDLLATAPGTFVEQLSRHNQAIAIRNDATFFTATLLVLVDGNPVYNLANGGMAWNLLTIPLEAIERIEIIRGSGGISWGANASTGIVNIISRVPKDLEKNKVAMEVGSENRRSVNALFGMKHENHAVNIAFSGAKDDGFKDINLNDERQQSNLFLRYDINGDEWNHQLNVGMIEDEAKGEVISAAGTAAGIINEGNSNASAFSMRSERFFDNDLWVIQTAYNIFEINFSNINIDFVKINSIVIESQFHKYWSSGAITFFSADYRHFDLNISDFFNPTDNIMDQFAVAINHQIPLSDSVSWELGFRLENNTNVGHKWHFAPATRLSYQINDQVYFWSSATRSIQLPTYIQQAVNLPFGTVNNGLTPLFLVGNPSVSAEVVDDFQLGLRWQFSNTLVDTTAYYTETDNVIAIVPGATTILPVPPAGLAQVPYKNAAMNIRHGLELSIKHDFNEHFNSQLILTQFKIKTKVSNPQVDTGINTDDTLSPNTKISWLNHYGYSATTRFQNQLSYYGGYDLEDSPFKIGEHFRMDMAIQHQVNKQFKLHFKARNILNTDVEARYILTVATPQKVKPSYAVEFEYQFD